MRFGALKIIEVELSHIAIEPKAQGRSPNKNASFSEGRSRFRASGDIAARNTPQPLSNIIVSAFA
jgi:hypothetical protein